MSSIGGRKPSQLAKIIFRSLLGLFLVLLITRLVVNATMKWRLQSDFSEILNVPVTVQRAGINLWLTQAWAEDVMIASPPGFDQPYFLKIPKMELLAHPAAWFLRPIHAADLTLWNVDLRIELKEKGPNVMALGSKVPPPPGAMPNSFYVKGGTFYNSTVTVIDKKGKLTIFKDTYLKYTNMSIRAGISIPINVEGFSTIYGERSRSRITVRGTVGPVVAKTQNFDLDLHVKRLDARDFLHLFESDPTVVLESYRVDIKGRFVCKSRMLDGSKFIITSTAGDTHPVWITGFVGDPEVTGSTALANLLILPFQKIFKAVDSTFKWIGGE